MTTCIILAGGKSSRMGRDKLMLDFGGETFLASIVGRFSRRFDRVYLSLVDPDKYPEINAERIADIYPGRGPISGLHAALSRTDGGVFLVAADLPLADPEAALRVMSLAEGYDACVPIDPDGRYEPLFAYYAPGIMPFVQKAIDEGVNKMARMLSGANVRFVTREDLGEAWKDGLLSNINRPEDYENLKKSL
ncbi:MAG: molybdenum cofactor guanylyltransferase [Oscillospiraceae bacterium]|nr:molybdenum cofactor guanylyltransferase [Oscillospiraceae bacterium]